MALCLNNVSGLKKKKDGVGGRVRLVDAAWVWTEPHSMRLKVSKWFVWSKMINFDLMELNCV